MRIETQNTAAREAVAAKAQVEPVASASATRLDIVGRQVTAHNAQQLPQDSGLGAQQVEGEQLSAAVRNINEYVQQVQRTLQFSIDDDTGTTVVKVLDSATDEVIRQFPPEEALALARHLQASQETQAQDTSGLFLHARA